MEHIGQKKERFSSDNLKVSLWSISTVCAQGTDLTNGHKWARMELRSLAAKFQLLYSMEKK